MLTITEAAARLGVEQKTLRRWSDRGIVPHVRLPSGQRRYDPDELAALIASWRVPATVAPEGDETEEGG